MVGLAYSLNCTVAGVDRLTDANITYLWWKDGSALLNQMAGIFSFSSLTISDAGEYECKATITSSFTSAPIAVQSFHPLAITLTCMLQPNCHPKVSYSILLSLVPNPTHVTVNCELSSPILPGTEIILTCTVTLSITLRDASPLKVAVHWTGPLGNISGSNPVMTEGSPMVYTSSAVVTISSTANYTCQAWVESASSVLSTSGKVDDTIIITTCRLCYSY